MAFPEVNEEAVYLTAGAVLPAAMSAMLQSLLNDDFNTCYSGLRQVVKENGYALADIATELSGLVAQLDLPDTVMAYIIDKLSCIEYRLSHGVSDKIQIGALVGAFVVARGMIQ
ncbi:Rfc5 [Symbiodinium microadriaticum]|nr:Rfc5 [Symbiodinium microadriaticum]